MTSDPLEGGNPLPPTGARSYNSVADTAARDCRPSKPDPHPLSVLDHGYHTPPILACNPKAARVSTKMKKNLSS